MGINNHICRCSKRKNEFDMYFVTVMCLKRPFPAYLETYTVNDKLEMLFILLKIKKNMRGVLPSSGRNHGNNQGTIAKCKSK